MKNQTLKTVSYFMHCTRNVFDKHDAKSNFLHYSFFLCREEVVLGWSKDSTCAI